MKKKIILFYIIFPILLGCSNSGDNELNTQNEEELLCCKNENVSSTSKINTTDITYEVFIFNVFTPNGDGTNDFFLIRNIENYPNNRVIIYDLADNTVFDKSGYNNTTILFAGINSINNNQLDPGTYRYRVYPTGNESDVGIAGYLCFFTEPTSIESSEVQDCILDTDDRLFN